MGREIKRVPLDFDYPLNKIWIGYVNPYSGYGNRCESCNSSGMNPETRQIQEDWYDNDNYGRRWWYERDEKGNAISIAEKYPGACRRWMHDLTQDEVDALAEKGRLHEFTHEWTEEGWVEKNPKVRPTAQEINLAYGGPNKVGIGFGHDAINSWICVEVRAKRLGVYGKCEECKGTGEIILSHWMKKRYNKWRKKKPPVGEGWQVWETVSEGSPITPVFKTAEDLIHMLTTTGLNWGASEGPYSLEAARNFVLGTGWVPSMIVTGEKMYSGIEAAELQEKK